MVVRRWRKEWKPGLINAGDERFSNLHRVSRRLSSQPPFSSMPPGTRWNFTRSRGQDPPTAPSSLSLSLSLSLSNCVLYVYVRVYVEERERENVCVCVCVCPRMCRVCVGEYMVVRVIV